MSLFFRALRRSRPGKKLEIPGARREWEKGAGDCGRNEVFVENSKEHLLFVSALKFNPNSNYGSTVHNPYFDSVRSQEEGVRQGCLGYCRPQLRLNRGSHAKTTRRLGRDCARKRRRPARKDRDAGLCGRSHTCLSSLIRVSLA